MNPEQNQNVLQTQPPTQPYTTAPESPAPAAAIEQPPQAPQASTPQPAAAPPVQTTAPIRQSQVMLLTGLTVFSGKVPAVLEWGADNRVRLYQQDATSNTFATLIDCAPNEIKSFSYGNGIANLKLRTGPRYSLQFADTTAQIASGALAVGVLGGAAGLGGAMAFDKAAANRENASDLMWWKQSLKNYGVGGFGTSASTLYKIDKLSFIIIGVVVVVIILVAMIASLASST